MNCGTWVKCTICDGHITQVLFLSQRSVYSNDQSLWMTFSDEGIHGSEVQGVNGLKKRSVDCEIWCGTTA